MDTDILEAKFTRIGARLKVADTPRHRFRTSGNLALDVRTDRHGEYFEIAVRGDTQAEIEILDLQPAERHLLLLVRDGREKDKYLCGHDERHWFVAGIPEKAPVGTVQQAKTALKPADVQRAEARQHLSGKARQRRKNAAFIRQGEWFFLPVPAMRVDRSLVLRNEPLRRGNGGKPHWAEYCYRTGGETMYICSRHPNGISAQEHRALVKHNRQAATWGWRITQRVAHVFVRGRVRHPDHRTVTLHCWHHVVMNTENQSRAMQNVVFLD
ncbi:MAG: hypothetical protein ACYC4U_05030 [Pirellulaceae bacterium]